MLGQNVELMNDNLAENIMTTGLYRYKYQL